MFSARNFSDAIYFVEQIFQGILDQDETELFERVESWK